MEVPGLEPSLWSRNAGDEFDEEDQEWEAMLAPHPHHHSNSTDNDTDTDTDSSSASGQHRLAFHWLSPSLAPPGRVALLVIAVAPLAHAAVCASLRLKVGGTGSEKRIRAIATVTQQRDTRTTGRGTASESSSEAAATGAVGVDCATVARVYESLDASILFMFVSPPSVLVSSSSSSPSPAPTSPSLSSASPFTPPASSLSFDLSVLLLTHLTAQRIVILDTQPMAVYVAGEADGAGSGGKREMEPPLLRCVHTSVARAPTPSTPSLPLAIIPVLGPPNLVSSFSASLVSHCEVHALCASLYLSYESPHYIYESMQAFENVLALAPAEGGLEEVNKVRVRGGQEGAEEAEREEEKERKRRWETEWRRVQLQQQAQQHAHSKINTTAALSSAGGAPTSARAPPAYANSMFL